MAQVTSPVILDSTGQQIVQALNNLNNNVKPTAAQIPMSGSDSTSVKSAIDSLNSKLTRIYKKTITGTTSATGAIDSQLNVSNYYIVSATLTRGSGTAGFAFWRGNDGYLRCFDIDMQPLANTAVSIDIIYCKNSEVGTE